MSEQSHRWSPRLYARICGVLYLYIIVAGISAEMFVRGKIIVVSDPAATALNLATAGGLFRLGFSAELLQLAFDVIVAVILYALFRPVNRYVALLAAFMRVACDIILAVGSLGHFATLRLLGNAEYLNSFEPAQRQGLALLAMRLHADAYAISLVFFGFACLALGYLIVRSRLLPWAIGVLMAVAGACYLVNSFAGFLAPAVASKLFPAILLPCFVAELGLTLALLVKGVDSERWAELTAGASA